MIAHRMLAVLLAPLALLAGGEAEAQSSAEQDRNPPVTLELEPSLDADGDSGVVRRDIRAQDQAMLRDGLLGAWEIGDGALLGVGRFTVPELARPRNHMEQEDHPTRIRDDGQGIAAVGIKLPF